MAFERLSAMRLRDAPPRLGIGPQTDDSYAGDSWARRPSRGPDLMGSGMRRENDCDCPDKPFQAKLPFSLVSDCCLVLVFPNDLSLFLFLFLFLSSCLYSFLSFFHSLDLSSDIGGSC